MQSMSNVRRAIASEDNQKFAIPVRHDFYITKNAKLATAQFYITQNAEQAAFIAKEVHDMQNECPYRMQECLDIINKWIKRDNLNFVNPFTPKENKRHSFNSHAFGLFVKFYNLKTNPKYCYVYKRNASPTYSYSNAALQLIYNEIKKDPEHIVQSLKSKLRKPTPGAKEF